MIEGIRAVAFDIDGTLYANWKLYLRIAPYFIKNFKFFSRFNKVRKVMHRTAPLADFYEYQARLLGQLMHVESEEAKSKIQRICYDGMKVYFERFRPYRYTYECIRQMKDAGLKIGILSDFPPDQKGEIWGIRDLCDVCIGSEESGALKPSLYPFGILAMKLGVRPEEILYVGNSVKYDVRGAKNAGMKSAYLLKGPKKWFNIEEKDADISFKSYRQLCDIVLK
ncbi:MAG: HAD family hydrolase [Treponema sp.]|nr:HAD family hydrolase [Treponema sp.]